MKKIVLSLLTLALLSGLITACRPTPSPAPESGLGAGSAGEDVALSFGESLETLGAYEGDFEGEKKDISVTCLSGTAGAYTLEGNTLTFSGIAQDSVYAISGKLWGNIVIAVPDAYQLELELTDFSLVSENEVPIAALSGDRVSLKAKSGTKNYVYDKREKADDTDENSVASAIYAQTDLKLCGKGALTVVSEHNKGIHTKDDLEVKNLSLLVCATDNALKGNDSVTLESGTSTLIATAGDGVKTTNSTLSDKGKLRGTVSVLGGTHRIFAASDGIDAARDVSVQGEETKLYVYTDHYSAYSETKSASEIEVRYIRFFDDTYRYSVKYVDEKGNASWVDAAYHSTVSDERETYYYYAFERRECEKLQVYVYSEDMQQGQETEYVVSSGLLSFDEDHDTFALSLQGETFDYRFTDRQTEDGENFSRSQKGIKAKNEIAVCAGRVCVFSKDDALHADGAVVLEDATSSTGDVTLSGGVLCLVSEDDGVRADGRFSAAGAELLLLVKAGRTGVENAQKWSVDQGVFVGTKTDGDVTLCLQAPFAADVFYLGEENSIFSEYSDLPAGAENGVFFGK